MNGTPFYRWSVLCLALGSSGLAGGPTGPATQDPVEELAARLMAARNGAARADLLAGHATVSRGDLSAVLLARGREVRDAGDWKVAKIAFDSAIQVAQAAGLRTELADALYESGAIDGRRGDLALAEPLFERAEAIYRELGDEKGLAKAWNARGSVANGLGRLAQADEFYQRSLEAFLHLGELKRASRAQSNLGLNQQKRGDYARALAAQQRALELDPKNTSALYNSGVVHWYQGESTLALDEFRSAAAFDREAGLAVDAAQDIMVAGKVQSESGDENGARASFTAARAVFEKAGDRELLGRLEVALGQLELRAGRPAAALGHAKAAVARLEAGDVGQLLDALNQMAEAELGAGQPQAALKAAERALVLADRLDSLSARRESWLRIGQAQEALGRSDKARAAYTAAIVAIEGQRERVAGDETNRQQFFEQFLEPYHRLLELALRGGDREEAFRLGEKARSRVLIDVLQHGRSIGERLLSSLERQREGAAELAVRLRATERDAAAEGEVRSRATTRLEEARRQLKATRTALFAAHPELRLARGEAAIVTPAKLAPLLADGSLALAFTVLQHTTHVFALSARPARHGVPSQGAVLRVVTLPLGAEVLHRRVSTFRENLARRDLGVDAEAVALFADLLGPLRDELRGRTNLYLVPDGALWELPFAALEPIRGHYLIEDAALTIAPSLTALAVWRARPAPARRTDGYELLAVAGTEVSANAAKLPLAERQVRAVAALYGPTSHMLIGREAVGARVKAEAGRARVLHFATHGVFEPASPLYSALLLSSAPAGSSDTGRLEAREILDLDLNADLAALSACETARGRIGAGEGVIGLSWALSVAGVRNTVVSLWKVDAESTANLMVEFHRRAHAGAAYADALQGAMLQTLRDPMTRHPFYWAPFVLIGDGRRSPGRR